MRISALLRTFRQFPFFQYSKNVGLRKSEQWDVELYYHPLTHKASCWINGVQVLAPTVLPSGLMPTIQYCGWAGLNVTQNQSKMDDFEIATVD
ncbi:MAG: hypothetical protein KDC71_06085 [Acidobacteria bacterium]|nr:hypothetical protein [Acidobacteriota bacterium]